MRNVQQNVLEKRAIQSDSIMGVLTYFFGIVHDGFLRTLQIQAWIKILGKEKYFSVAEKVELNLCLYEML